MTSSHHLLPPLVQSGREAGLWNLLDQSTSVPVPGDGGIGILPGTRVSESPRVILNLNCFHLCSATNSVGQGFLTGIGLMNKCVTLAKLALSLIPHPHWPFWSGGPGRGSPRGSCTHKLPFLKALGFPRCREAPCPIVMSCPQSAPFSGQEVDANGPRD